MPDRITKFGAASSRGRTLDFQSSYGGSNPSAPAVFAMNKPDEQFSEEEAKRRFEAALRGARAVGPLPMKEVPPKRPRKRNKRAAPEVSPEAKD